MEWVRIGYHTPMAWQEFLSLSRWDRSMLHKKLNELISGINGDDDEPTGPTPPSRASRRTGLY